MGGLCTERDLPQRRRTVAHEKLSTDSLVPPTCHAGGQHPEPMSATSSATAALTAPRRTATVATLLFSALVLATTTILTPVLGRADATVRSSASLSTTGPPQLRWPTAPPHPITRGFVPPATPYGPGHRGVDIDAPPGAFVSAAADGVISYAGPVAGRGVVTVRHAAQYSTTYEPVTAVVRRGQRISAGTELGRLTSGHPGCWRPACLHWGLRRTSPAGFHYLDPLSALRPDHPTGPIRLLPLDGRRTRAAAELPTAPPNRAPKDQSSTRRMRRCPSISAH